MKNRIDKKIMNLGFVKTDENDLCVVYKRSTDGYQHVVALLHKASGKHLIQSYDPTLCDKNGIGNTAVGLTYKENMLFLKKMRKLGWC